MNKIFDFGGFLKSLNESVSNNDLIENIDYTLLSPSATEEEILELCEKATKLGVKSVCVLPKMVRVAAEALSNSPVLVCTVVSFPEGTNTPDQKLAETKQVIADGADEVDMVLNYPLLKSLLDKLSNIEEADEEYEKLINQLAHDDVAPLVDECHSNTNKDGDPITLKVIVESGLLTEDETQVATYICLEADADYIKTSTGMVAVGAELDKVQIMRNVIEDTDSNMKIKASGGIRTMADLQKFAPYVDRFGVGFGSVDKIFGGEEGTATSDY
jgi:deoxyribose-phosphate aldolase